MGLFDSTSDANSSMPKEADESREEDKEPKEERTEETSGTVRKRVRVNTSQGERRTHYIYH